MASTTRRLIPALTITATLAVTLAACATDGTDAAPGAISGHVHGLGLDPASGETYAATHNGVWLLPTDDLADSYPAEEAASAGAPRQIGGNTQDTMGFTVGRPGLLLGSGHPGPGEQRELNPPNLGLIASTDRANTWESISLSGQTDFHDLAAVELPTGELRIYGYDATAATIKVSDDTGQTWTDQAAVELRDLATDPSNPDRVYATTAQGLMRSDDRGGSFQRVDGAPPLYLVASAPDAGGFVGIDVDGVIWTSEGTTWTKRASIVGTPEALAYVGGADTHWLLIADERGVVATDDYGETVTILATTKE